MGYELHITRAGHWTESERIPIRLEEWLAYVEQDDEMRCDGFAEAHAPDGSVIRIEAEGLSVWTAYSRHNINGGMAWFDWRRGRIVVKSTNPEIISKMKRIAECLGANVMGDEGELY